MLQTVTVFKKVKEEYIHKCRENKQVFKEIIQSLLDFQKADLSRRFIVRDFKWDPQALEKQNKELSELKAEEKELWVSASLFRQELIKC